MIPVKNKKPAKQGSRWMNGGGMMSVNENGSGYVGRYGYDGKLYGAGKFIGGALSLYGRDGKFHYDPRYEKMYYEGEFDEISDEEFEKYKKEMDAQREN